MEIARALGVGIVPATDTPGAAELPVAEMIFSVAASWPREMQQQLAGSLEFVDTLSQNLFGEGVAQLDAYTLATFVELLADSADLRPFWVPFRTLVVLNYYGLPEGYEPLGLPGPSIDSGGFTADGEPAAAA
nr:gluconate 2-dehydrogenase subunit 3 family protein [Microbulbifer rhizosphaerae]